MAGRLKDKVAVVTGAAPRGEGVGNGMATAMLFAREGAKVVLVNRSAERADKLARQIKDAFNQNFFDPKTAEYGGGTQTANALALFLDLVPQKHRGSVSFHLQKDVLDHHNNHLTTGIIGTKYLMPALTATGRSDIAYHLSVQTTYPSWGYMVEKGATTIWELWQDKNRPLMNSHDHPALGSVGAWFYRALGGIDLGPGGEGYSHIRIAPQIVEDLRWASATIDTIRGRVSSSWTHEPGETTVEVTIPVNADAEVLIPEDPRMTEVTVRAIGQMIWRKGEHVKGGQGAADAHEVERDIVVKVGSGHYIFQLISD